SPAPRAGPERNLLLDPPRPRRAGGRAALVVGRGLFADGTPGRPLGPSPFLRALALAPKPGEAPALARARECVLPVLDSVSRERELPFPLEDSALALSISVRSESHDPSDWISLKEQALAAPPPVLDVTEDGIAPGGDRLLRGGVTPSLHVTA